MVYVKQLRPALEWCVAFLVGSTGPLQRSIELHAAPDAEILRIATDASPWGLGAVLEIASPLPCESMKGSTLLG